MIGVIKGTGSCVPGKVVTNDDIAGLVETSDGWIRERTGIEKRHIATEETCVDLAAEAARRALQNAGMDAEELDMILVSTISPTRVMPCTACEVQAAIGAKKAQCFDLSAACSGFVVAWNTVNAYMAAGFVKKALIIGSECLSRLTDWQDRSTCILFGDGAGAAVVTAAESGIIGLNMHSNGAKGGVLTCGSRSTGNFLLGKKPELGYMTMEGQEVFKFAVKQVPECIKEVLEETGNTADDIDLFVIHQANYRIIESIAKRLKVDLEKFPVNMEHYGNTSGASVPILLDELNRAGKLKQGDKLVLAGFGAGLTWGAMLLEW